MPSQPITRIRNRRFPRDMLLAGGRVENRRVRSRARNAPWIFRHFEWARAIARKFVTRNTFREVHPETLIFLSVARKWCVFLRHPPTQARSSDHQQGQPSLLRERFPILEGICADGVPRLSARVLDSHVSRRSSRPLLALPATERKLLAESSPRETSSTRPAHVGSDLTPSLPVTLLTPLSSRVVKPAAAHNRSRKTIEASGLHNLGYHVERGYGWPPGKSLQEFRDTIWSEITRTSVRANGRVVRHVTMASDSGPRDVAARIVRQLRRREEAPPLQPRDVAPTRAALPTSGSDFVVERTMQRPQRQLGPTLEPEAARATGRLTPAVNVTQITDEVIRQLDHRLVATRERMGRI